VNLHFFLAQLVVFVLFAIHLSDKLQRPAFLGPKLQHILQGFAGVRVGMIVHVLARQAIPILDLLFAPPVFDLALQRQRLRIVGLHLQYVLQLLQRQRVFRLFEAGLGCFHKLRNRFAPHGSVELMTQRTDRGVDVAFRLQFAKNFSGKLVVTGFQRLGGALHPRSGTSGVEEFDGLVPQRFVKHFTKLPRAGETVPRMLGHALVHHAANGLAYRRVDLRSRRWNLFADSFDNLVCPGALERLPAGERFVAHHTQRKNVGRRRQRLHLDLLRGHVNQRAFLSAGVSVGHVRDTEIDDFHRVIFHNKDVARLQVAMHQAALVRRLQASASLRNDFDRAFHCQPVTRLADECVQGRARQQWHHEVGFVLAVFFELANVENLDNVGMAHGGEHIAFFIEELQRRRIGEIEDSLNRHFTAHHGVVGAVHQPHAALAQHLSHLVAAGQFSRDCGILHDPPLGEVNDLSRHWQQAPRAVS